MNNYQQLNETLNYLKDTNKFLKESLEKYDSGEIYELLLQIKELSIENDFLQRIVNKRYTQIYNEIKNEKNINFENPSILDTPVSTPNVSPLTPNNTPIIQNKTNTSNSTTNYPESNCSINSATNTNESEIEQQFIQKEINVFPYINFSKFF